MNNDIEAKTNSATKWAAITELAAKLVAPITSMVLARLLTPSAFGVIVTVQLIISFAEIFTDAGFQKYLIQKQFSSKEDLYKSTTIAFWTNFLLSVVIWGVIIVFSAPIAKIVGNEGHADVIIISCASIPLAAFSSIQMAIFKRELDFKSLFHVRLIGILIPIIVTIPLASWTHSYWSLVFGMLSRDLANAIVLTIKSPWRPTFYYSFDKLNQMLSFTIWTIVESITIWATGYVDVFIVSSFLSSHYLGLYRTSMTTVNSIMALVVAATTPVLFSSLSRLQDFPEEYSKMFFKYQKYVSIILIPLGTAIFIFKEFVTNVLLGEQWLETSFFIGCFSLLLPFKVLISDYSSEVCRSLGKPKISVYRQLFMMLVIFVCVYWTVNDGYIYLSIMRTLSMFGGIISGFIVLRWVGKIRIHSVLINILPSSIGALLMIIIIKLLPPFVNAIQTIIYLLIAISVYIAAIFVFPKERSIVIRIAQAFPISKK